MSGPRQPLALRSPSGTALDHTTLSSAAASPSLASLAPSPVPPTLPGPSVSGGGPRADPSSGGRWGLRGSAGVRGMPGGARAQRLGAPCAVLFGDQDVYTRLRFGDLDPMHDAVLQVRAASTGLPGSSACGPKLQVLATVDCHGLHCTGRGEGWMG